MISGRKFAEKCNWVHCNRYSDLPFFNVSKSKSGDKVFLNGDLFNQFVQSISTSFPVKKYIIIIHNTDNSFGENQLKVLLPYSIRIYAINTIITHPILKTIPIGFPDKSLDVLTKFKYDYIPRDYEIYANFSFGTNMNKRMECYEAFKNDPRLVMKQNRSRIQFLEDLRRSKYVLCPEGNGIDTHRVYESIICGAIPVVLRNSLSHMYENLPVCIVDKWTDKFYEPHQKLFNFDVSFWFNSSYS